MDWTRARSCIIYPLHYCCITCASALCRMPQSSYPSVVPISSFWLTMHAGVLPDMVTTSQSPTPAWVLPRTEGPLAQNVQVVPDLIFYATLMMMDMTNHGSPTGLTTTPEYVHTRKHGDGCLIYTTMVVIPQRPGYAKLLGSSIQSRKDMETSQPSFDAQRSTR